MTMLSDADTIVRPAAVVLQARLSGDPTELGLDTAALDALAIEHARTLKAITDLVDRMDDPAASTAALDRVTTRIAGLLVAAEDLRHARARAVAKRAGDEARWRDYLTLA